MNWEALGAIAELLGAGGVVISLLYLAAQIRQNSRIAKVTAQEAAVRGFRDVQKSFLLDPVLNRLLMRSTKNWHTAPPEEQARLANALFQILKTWESIHLYYSRGLLEDDTWQGWNTLFQHYINTPGWREYWQLRSDVFSHAFRSYVEQASRPGEYRTVADFTGGYVAMSSETAERQDE